MATSAQEVSGHGIRLVSRWHFFKGCAYGCGPSSVLGRLTVSAPRDFDLAALDAFMATLVEEAPSLPATDHDVERALADRLMRWLLAVQRQQRIPVFGPYDLQAAGGAGADGSMFVVACASHSAQATIEAFRWLRDAINLLLAQPGPASTHQQLRAGFDEFMTRLQKLAPAGINNFHLLNAAHGMEIPSRMLARDIYCYGHGVHARWFNSTMTERTSTVGVGIARRKSVAARILALHAIPVARHRPAASEDEAAQIAAELGYPVVVKPDDQEQGRGVEAGLQDEAAVRSAWQAATKFSTNILVEKHHFGEDYRLTVLGDRVVKILHRRAGGVFGDGRLTVRELVAIEQQGARFRRVQRQTGRILLEVDDEAISMLGQQGMAPGDVPAAGRFVVLRRRSNISAGGIQTLVPAESAHADNLMLAVRATSSVRLDLCGVDMLVPDIARSWLETGGVIIEVNAQPQIGISTAPEVYRTIVRDSVAGNGRIPLHLIVCPTPDDVPTEAGVLRLMDRHGCNGASTPQGVWVNGTRVAAAGASGFNTGLALVLDRTVRAALVVMTAEEITVHGLPADRFETATVRHSPDPDGPALKAALTLIAGHVPGITRSPAADRS